VAIPLSKTIQTVFVRIRLVPIIRYVHRSTRKRGRLAAGNATMTSQQWSGIGVNAERVINNADSHVGSTKSDKVRAEIDQLLRIEYQ
jgi:hypothetical protein